MTSAMKYLWPLILASQFYFARVSPDEEDPLQKVAQAAARDKHLNEILNLLETASRKEKEPSNYPASCSHSILDLKVNPNEMYKTSQGQTAALRLANLLNNIFLAEQKDGSPTQTYRPQFYYALTLEVLEGEPSLVSVGIAFVRGEFRKSVPQGQEGDTFIAYTYRRNGVTYTVDLAELYDHQYDNTNVEGSEWFTQLTYRVKQRGIKENEDLAQGMFVNYALTKKRDEAWFSRPILDCGASDQWVLAYSLPFFGRTDGSAIAQLKGVVLATFNLKDVDLNQCRESFESTEKIIFGGTHKCDTASTQCVPDPGHGFVKGGYICKCKERYHLSSQVEQYFNGTEIEKEYLKQDKSYRFGCSPCPEGCDRCSGSQICLAKYSNLTRLVPVCIQVGVIIVSFILIFSIFKLRRCKVIASSLWTMLEVILIGAVIIYSTVFLRFPEPSVLLCLLEPWVRELGFALFYGAIVLKLYRTLVDHRTRKAHRYIIRDRDLLRYLSLLLVFMSCYLAAWAAFTGQLALEGHSILDRGITYQGLTFSVCRSFWWEYVTEVGELLFVMFGLYLSWQLHRAARDTKDVNELQERRALAAALFLELVFSSSLYISRHILWLLAHPDHIFLVYFLRTHSTITVSLILILVPKLWCAGGLKGRDISRRTLASSRGVQELRLCEALGNGELEAADISQMDPEEIRCELRRVYTQLEELRSRTMRKDNPHISKRRGGRKPTHRRFSLQTRKGSKDKIHSKRLHNPQFDGIEDNKTPEESVCSIEGPSVLSIYADGPSTYSDVGTPSVLPRSYKM